MDLIELLRRLPVATQIKKGVYGWTIFNLNYPRARVSDEPNFGTAVRAFIELYNHFKE